MRRLGIIIVMVAALAGCATTGGGSQPHGKLGSGSLNQSIPSESVSLTGSGTFWSTAHYAGSMDTLNIQLYAASGSAACTVALEVSNSYQSTVNIPSDETVWVTDSTVSPGSISGAVSNYMIERQGLGAQYERLKFVCSSGSTTLTVSTMLKGG